jgi:hypothetical protein
MAHPRIAEGTEAWFVAARQRCVDHLRALASVRTAHERVMVLLREWEAADPVVLGALHSAAVVAYCQPFTDTKTNRGSIQYRLASLKGAAGFDRDLHDHLLELRNKLIAHADYAVLPSTIAMQVVGDEQLPIRIVANVKTFAGLADRGLAERLKSHLDACSAGLDRALNTELRNLAREGQKYPKTFGATHNLPLTSDEVHITGEWSNVPDPSGPAATVGEPEFPAGFIGYRYVLDQHRLGLIERGKYTVFTGGKLAEIEFDA